MKNSAGCSLLNEAGVSMADLYGGVEICLKCPYDECLVKSRDDELIETRPILETKEVYVICKTCGATETLTFLGDRLSKTSKWYQRDGKIYHLRDCGECK